MSLTVHNNYWQESSMLTDARNKQSGEKVFSKEFSAKNISEAEKIEQMTPEEELEVFKKEFYAELSKINNHRTVSNMAIDISEDAFKKMKQDPQYKQQADFEFSSERLGRFICPKKLFGYD